jgi:hypothetical protein
MSSFFSATIATDVVIRAPPSLVRKTFLDFPEYPNWNPFIKSIKTTASPKVGDRIDFVANGTAIHSTLYENVSDRFSWVGKLGAEWIFRGHHFYEFEPSGDVGANGETVGCKFAQREEFSGVLMPLFFLIREDTEKGFKAMNEALKERVEGDVGVQHS